MNVHRVDLQDPDQVNQFIEVPYRLYRDYPHWVPRMRREMKTALSPDEHPFHRHSRAAFFVARTEGELQGRIAALDPIRYNEHNGTNSGFFYYFEAVDDSAVAAGLFEAAFHWLRQRGRVQVIGPRGMLQGDAAGVLVEGHEHRPAMGVPYNPPYYAGLLQRNGFEKATDYLSGYLSRGYKLPARLHELAERVKQRRGYSIHRFRSKDELRSWIPRVQQVYNRSFQGAFGERVGFAPMTEPEMEIMAERLISIARPDLIKLVMKGDEPVGFLLAYPNIGPALRRAQGRLWPFGWLDILIEMRRTKWLDLNGIGILPEHQGIGANTILYTELEKTVQNYKFEHADVVQIREENLKSMGDMQALGVQWYKRHRLYQRLL